MAKTLLQITQDILSDIDGDQVNSIYDTEESEQVSRIVLATYRFMVTTKIVPRTMRAVALTPRSDNLFPTHMILNDDVQELIDVRYNRAKLGETRRNYEEVLFKEPDDFLRSINSRNNDSSNVDVILDDSGIELLILNDLSPRFYTSFDDLNLVFDSYDSGVDSTLTSSKFQARAYIIPDFPHLDASVPVLPIGAEGYLIDEATSRCQLKLRQFQDVKAEQASVTQRHRLSRKSWQVGGGIKFPNYGMSRGRSTSGHSRSDTDHTSASGHNH